MEVASIPATLSEHFELNKAFWMQGENIWKMSSLLEVLGLGLLEKKKPSLDWETLGIGFPENRLAMQKCLLWEMVGAQ